MRIEFWKLKRFFKNIWTFRKALWEYGNFDYYGTLMLMEIAFKDMSESHKNHSYLENKDSISKDLLVMSNLCKRIKDDDYGMDCIDWSGGLDRFNPIPNRFPTYKSKTFWKDVDKIKQDDLELLCSLFKRKILSCWH